MNKKRYWVGTMNRVCTTNGEEMPKEDGWKEVSEKEYEIAFARAWEIACNTIWHC